MYQIHIYILWEIDWVEVFESKQKVFLVEIS